MFDYVFVNKELREGKCPICKNGTIHRIEYNILFIQPEDPNDPPWYIHAAPPDDDLKTGHHDKQINYLGRRALLRSVRCDRCRRVFRGPCIQECAFDSISRDTHDKCQVCK